ncbi:MAG: AmmeMemoRadiSam system protein A [Brevinematia bacterium]
MKKLKLTSEQKRKLLLLARLTIKKALFENLEEEFPDMSDEIFSEEYGVFVTLTIHGRLRGCIGYIEGIKPLREAVKDLAIQSAFKDPRFYPLTKEEFSAIEVEISVLYPLEEVKDINEIEVGKHGIVMERGYYKGLLLPQVATEYGWNREEFLNQTCRKAGMEPYCWENGAKVYKFEAEVFGEKDV